MPSEGSANGFYTELCVLRKYFNFTLNPLVNNLRSHIDILFQLPLHFRSELSKLKVVIGKMEHESIAIVIFWSKSCLVLEIIRRLEI